MGSIGIVVFHLDALVVVRASSVRTLIFNNLVRLGEDHTDLLVLGSFRHIQLPANDTIDAKHDGLHATVEQWDCSGEVTEMGSARS